MPAKKEPRKQDSRRTKPAPRKAPARKAAPAGGAPRADYGLPIDGFFAKPPPHLREILEALRKLIEEVAPEAHSSIKWGMPFYTIDGQMMCALGAHKSHVNLILVGPPAAFDDREGRLEGTGKGGRHLKLTALADLPRAAVRRWVGVAAQHARKSPKSGKPSR